MNFFKKVFGKKSISNQSNPKSNMEIDLSKGPFPNAKLEERNDFKRLFDDEESVLEQLKHWIEIGGDPNWKYEDCKILHYAIHGGSERTVKYLLKNGADIEEKVGNGCTPLIISYEARYLGLDLKASIEKLLFKNKANPKATDVDGNNARHVLFYAGSYDKNTVDSIKKVLDKYNVPN